MMNNEVKEIIVDLLERLYKEHFLNMPPHDHIALERNMFEAELKEIYDNLDAKIGACDQVTVEEFEEEIESLEETIKEQKEEYDALMVKYEDLEEDYKDLEKTLDKVKEAIWS